MSQYNGTTLQVQMPACAAPLKEPHRYFVLYGGRNGVKSWSVARHLIIRGITEPIRWLCARETMLSISESVHSLLSDQIKLLGLDSYYDIQKSAIYGKNGTRFVYTGLRGLSKDKTLLKAFESFDGAWVEEAQSVSKSSWATLIPTIRKAKSQIMVTFNPELASDETWQRFIVNTPPDCVLIKTSYRDNPWLSDEAKADMDHLKATDPEEFEHIYEGVPRSQIQGAIFAKELAACDVEQRIRRVPYDPLRPVQTFWDIGDRHTSIWFTQSYPLEHHIIDYVDESALRSHDASLPAYFKVLADKPYIYSKHNLPHDAKSPQLSVGMTIQRQAEQIVGRDKINVLPVMSLKQQIAATRLVFPKCYFDSDNCADGITALRHYRWPDDSASGVEGTTPLHDWASHPGSAFQYFAIGHQVDNKNQYTPHQVPVVRRQYSSAWS